MATGIGIARESFYTDEPRILVVDDDPGVRASLETVLRISKFHVTTAANFSEALRLINSRPFDVLLSDLHMAGGGNGFSIVSAMRHANPNAVTFIFTGYSALENAMNTILLQADEVLVKPMTIPALVFLICKKLQRQAERKNTIYERAAAILEREAYTIIDNLLLRIDQDSELTAVPLGRIERIGNFRRMLQEQISRLRDTTQIGAGAFSKTAFEHGQLRYYQGYTIAMLIQESRTFQLSIFQALQNNLSSVDFSFLLVDLLTIADEIESQLKSTLTGFATREKQEAEKQTAA